jgi:type IV pilus assembly protein PilM
MILRRPPVVGLDIGTSAVRAAQIVPNNGASALLSFAQVSLPSGAVVDGEIHDEAAVSDALSQLWRRARINSKSAVIGVGNQRVVVREVELPYVEPKDFASSLRYHVADHIPMPVDSAELDFKLIDDYTSEDREHMMHVLIVAADRDMVESFVRATAAAGIEPTAVDLAPFAIARAVSPAARGESGIAGTEAIVDVGAGVTNIIVHDNGEPRFVRILLVGGNDLSAALARELDVSFEEAEAIKLDSERGTGDPTAEDVIRRQSQRLVDEVRSSLDYFLSQNQARTVSSLVISGGGSLLPGLVGELERALTLHVHRAAPLAELNVSKSKLTREQLHEAEPVAAAAVGLAMGASRR